LTLRRASGKANIAPTIIRKSCDSMTSQYQ
jgi:hypothetical protein